MTLTQEELKLLPFDPYDLENLSGTVAEREAFARSWLAKHQALEHQIAARRVPGDEPPEEEDQ